MARNILFVVDCRHLPLSMRQDLSTLARSNGIIPLSKPYEHVWLFSTVRVTWANDLDYIHERYSSVPILTYHEALEALT